MTEGKKDIKKGSLVVLRSGGPLMTVLSINDGDADEAVINCSWFSSGIKEDAVNHMHRGRFNQESLVLIEE